MSRMSSSGSTPGEEIERQVHDVHVAGALSVAKERALDSVGAGEDAQFSSGDAGATVVVRMQGEHNAVTAIHVTKEHSMASA